LNADLVVNAVISSSDPGTKYSGILKRDQREAFGSGNLNLLFLAPGIVVLKKPLQSSIQ